MIYDLSERTNKFSRDILSLCKKIKLNLINKNLIDQLIRSSTSIGANYCEANGASSKNDFRNKIHICKKEAQETKYWLELLNHVEKEYNNEIGIVLKECHELILIFGKISGSMKK